MFIVVAAPASLLAAFVTTDPTESIAVVAVVFIVLRAPLTEDSNELLDPVAPATAPTTAAPVAAVPVPPATVSVTAAEVLLVAAAVESAAFADALIASKF